MAALFRLFLILPFAYIVACAAAGITIYSAWYSTDLVPQDGQIEFVLGTMFTSMTFGAIGFSACLIGIALTEVFKIRSFIPYVLLGIATGYLNFWLVDEQHSLVQLSDWFLASFPSSSKLYLAGGSVWGLIFWIIAGRNAGSWFMEIP